MRAKVRKTNKVPYGSNRSNRTNGEKSAIKFACSFIFSYLCSRKRDWVNGNQVRDLSCSCSCKPFFPVTNKPLTFVGKA
jgi:hypothetical protein